MRESTKRVLFNMANSLAMNGLTSDTKIVKVTLWYEYALTGLTIISAVGLAGSAFMTLVQAFSKKED
jgi:hypothetical protein